MAEIELDLPVVGVTERLIWADKLIDAAEELKDGHNEHDGRLADLEAGGSAVDRPSAVLEGRWFFQYGPSRGAGGNATRIHFDRLRQRIGSGIASNQSIGGFLASDTASRMYGAMTASVQGTASDSSSATTQAGTWANRALMGGVLLTWPFGNDALMDGASTRNSTTTKSRKSAANALHATICLARAEVRVESSNTLTAGITSGQPTVTITGGTSKFYKGMLVTATGVPANTYVGTVSSTGFTMSSSRTTQVNVNATATNAAVSMSLTTVPGGGGSWTYAQGASSPTWNFSGSAYARSATNSQTSSYVLHLDEARKVQWVTAAIDDPEYTAKGGAAGSSYSIVVDGGTAITGTTADEHKVTDIGPGLPMGLGHGPKAVDLGTLAAGAHTIVITNTGTTGKWLYDDCLLVESLTPPTVLVMKEVELPAAYYSNPLFSPYSPSYAKTQIYNALIDTEVALWPADNSVITRDISADTVNGTYDKSVHISGLDGLYSHFNDAGEALVTDKIMGWLNALPARPGFTKG